MSQVLNQSVAAIILRGDSVLLAQRKPGGAIGNRWEFPGGKVDPAEDPPAALSREIAEELGVSCSIGEQLAAASFENAGERYRLQAYAVELDSTQFALPEHTQTRWVRWPEVGSYDLPDSDRALLDSLLARFSSNNRPVQ